MLTFFETLLPSWYGGGLLFRATAARGFLSLLREEQVVIQRAEEASEALQEPEVRVEVGICLPLATVLPLDASV